MSENRPDHPVFAAIYDPVTWVGERFLLSTHREWLAEDLRGTVLEVGAGTGAMFPYFAAAARERSLDLRAIEPDPNMRSRAEARAAELGLDVTITGDRAEALSAADDSVDVVVAALVLCTVDDPGAVLDEFARVLRPGGEVRFLEHVHASGPLARVQDLLAPAWERAAAGCRLDRPTGDRIRAHDAFEVVAFDRFRGVPPIDPLIRGVARRREDGGQSGSR